MIFNLIAEFYSTSAGRPITTGAGFDFCGQFYYLPIRDTVSLSECLRRRTIGLFLKLDLITRQFAQTLLYHTAYNPYFKQNTSQWNATDFIAQLTQFIPPWGVRYVHYYGLYSSRCKARWESLPLTSPMSPRLAGKTRVLISRPSTTLTPPYRPCLSAPADRHGQG